MDLKVYREYTKVTRRFKEAELVLKNAKIINVFIILAFFRTSSEEC